MSKFLFGGEFCNASAFAACSDQASAVFSTCERFRYALARVFDPLLYTPDNVLLSIGLNPSTANHEPGKKGNDATIRREIYFAQRWGFGALWKANLFALRST
ncbi:MAG TPA: DUF1643 domain-containing protein, partial [Polyangiaceae bacterium]|nr:DUF1643 domain-containing protein [Polyangiaceae bacterium]